MVTVQGVKTPAYAVLITFLNLFIKWVPSVVLLQAFCLPTSGEEADLHTANKERPQVQSVGSKTAVNHAHRRGEKTITNLRFQSVESIFRICFLIDRRAPY